MKEIKRIVNCWGTYPGTSRVTRLEVWADIDERPQVGDLLQIDKKGTQFLEVEKVHTSHVVDEKGESYIIYSVFGKGVWLGDVEGYNATMEKLVTLLNSKIGINVTEN